MAFDESLLRDEPSGFDESLLRDEEEQPKRPIPKLSFIDRASGPLYAGLAGLEQFVVEPLAHPIKTLERGAEAAATMITGKPKQLLVLPSEVLERPIATIPQIPQQEGVAAQVGAGLGNSVIDFANFFLTPEGIATMGIGGLPKAAQRNLLKTFGAQMATSAPQNLVGAVENAKQGNWQEAAKHLGAAGAETFFARQMGRAAVEPTLTVPQVIETKGKTDAGGSMQFEVLPPEAKGGEIDASRIREAAKVHGPVLEVPVEGAQKVPAEVSGEGVQSQARPLQEAEPGRAVDDLTKGPNETQRQKEGQEQGPVPVAQEPGAAPAAPEFTLTPAVEAEGRIFTGKNHSDAIMHAIRKEGVDALDAPHNFLGSDGKMYTRKEAARIYEEKTGKKPFAEEGLHSHELEEAGMLEHVTEPREVKPAAVTPEGPAPAVAEGRAVQAEPGRNVSPSGAAVGIAPPGTELLQDIIAKAIAKPKDVPHPIQIDVSTPLPDFQEHGASKKIFAQPFGFERIPVLGSFLGGTRRLAGHVNDSITTYWNERQVGRAVASAFGNQYKWLDDPFTIVDGQITNIEPSRPNQSRYISDVFENLQRDPKSYRLTQEQQRAFDAIQTVEKDFNRLESKYDLAKRSEDEGGTGAYFPRIVTSRPGATTGGLRRGQSVGTKAFFEKERLFDTEAEGWEKGYKYEPSIVNRLATRAERLYKRMADKRLAEDKSLGGTGRKELEAQLKETYAEEVASGEMTEAKIGQMADSLEARGRVFQPAFFNKIFPEETAKALNKAFPNTNSGLLAAATSVNNAVKGLKLGFDLGVGFIQGQATLARYPVQWGKAIYHSMRAFPSPNHFPGYVRQNIEPIRELAQLGSSVGHLEEYMAGLGRKELLGRIPGVGAASRAFGRQFSTFLDVAKVEIWKAYRDVVPKEQWNDVVQSLESVLMSGRMETTGISGKRAMTERALLLAPSYYRGGLNLIGAMAEKGVSGQIARQALGAYAVGGAALFYGVAKALGMDDEDIKKRFNPARSDFLMWRVKHGDKASEIGFGGFFRSLLRLAGNIAKTSIETPGNWKSLDPKKNPIVKWYRGHAGPVVSLSWDMFSGKDYLGRDTDIGSIGKAITPLSIEAAKGTPGQPQPSAVDVAASVVGLSGFPASAQPSTKETFVNIHNWMAKSEDPKVQAEFTKRQEEEYAKPYAPLRQALAQNDIKAAGEAYAELLKTRKPKNIIQAIRPFSRDANYVRHDKPLTGSKALERKFLESLSDEDRKLYDAAKKERMELWTRFQKVLEARKE